LVNVNQWFEPPIVLALAVSRAIMAAIDLPVDETASSAGLVDVERKPLCRRTVPRAHVVMAGTGFGIQIEKLLT
jgi:hypothetical protein